MADPELPSIEAAALVGVDKDGTAQAVINAVSQEAAEAMEQEIARALGAEQYEEHTGGSSRTTYFDGQKWIKCSWVPEGDRLRDRGRKLDNTITS